MGLLIFYFLITILISFSCSLLESVLLSTSPAYIELKCQEGKRFGLILKRFKLQVDRPLTAILTINTIANMMGATGVGAQAYITFGDIYMAAISGALTLAVLIFGEIVPKTFGATKWKALAPFTAYSVQFLILLTYPFVIATEKVYQWLGVIKSNAISREEMIVTAEIGASDGVIREKESLVIRNLLKLDVIEICEIMTPRSVVSAIDKNQTVQEVVETNKPIRFSRIPVYDNSLDNVVGLLHRFKLMDASSQDLDNLEVEKLMVPIHQVPETISVSAVLDQFLKRKEHLFLVVDNYGVPTGIVTLEDAIETLLGVEIVDESDSVVDMRAHAMEQWLVKKNELRHQKNLKAPSLIQN